MAVPSVTAWVVSFCFPDPRRCASRWEDEAWEPKTSTHVCQWNEETWVWILGQQPTGHGSWQKYNEQSILIAFISKLKIKSLVIDFSQFEDLLSTYILGMATPLSRCSCVCKSRRVSPSPKRTLHLCRCAAGILWTKMLAYESHFCGALFPFCFSFLYFLWLSFFICVQINRTYSQFITPWGKFYTDLINHRVAEMPPNAAPACTLVRNYHPHFLVKHVRHNDGTHEK